MSFCLNFWEQKAKKIYLSLKTKSLEKVVWSYLSTSYIYNVLYVFLYLKSNSSFLKYYKNGNKKEKIEFLFEFLRTKSKENIPVLENKKFGKGCLKLSEHILYLKCFLSFKYVVGGIIKHSPSHFCPCFLINQVGMSGFHRLHVV